MDPNITDPVVVTPAVHYYSQGLHWLCNSVFLYQYDYAWRSHHESQYFAPKFGQTHLASDLVNSTS